MDNPGLRITIEGLANSGKTSTANIIKDLLIEQGYQDVEVVEDTPPSTNDKRSSRMQRTMERPVRIHVRLFAKNHVDVAGTAATALAAYRSSLLSGERETRELKALYDAAQSGLAQLK